MKRLMIILSVLALVLAACGGDSDGGNDTTAGNGDTSATSGDAANGEEIYSSTCSSCHGADARGLEGLGKDLHNNEFVDGLNDDELVAFLEEGRPAGDPANEAGVDMPPKGGNPSLTEQDLYDVAAYLRTLD